MNVILLDNVENLGSIGDMVTVKPGYGRNYLLPSGKAALATKENVAEFEARRAELEKAAAEELAAAKSRADLIQGMDLVIPANVGPEGKLFGSLGTIDIAEAAVAAGHELERSEVRLPDGPLKAAGEYDIEVHLHTDVNVTIKVSVVGDHDEEAAADRA